MNIFVGNLSFEAKESDVQAAFAAFGTVDKITIVKEKKADKSRGFGFVLMPNESEANAAIEALNGKEILGRPINVMAAFSKKPSRRRTIKSKEPPKAPAAVQIPLTRTGKYREGRRTVTYFKKRRELGLGIPAPEPKNKPNPMRWRKKTKQDYRKKAEDREVGGKIFKKRSKYEKK